MPKTDSRVDAYIAKSADFAKPILTHLRDLAHRACPDVEETMKWQMPHFVRKGILFAMAGFKQHCTLHFWHGNLFLPSRARKDASMGQFGRITRLADLPDDKVLLGYIKKAAQLNEAGVKKTTPSRRDSNAAKKRLVVPRYFLAALKKNKKALAAFEAFSYSHRKEYLEWITEAKRAETRQKRIETAIEWLTQGKPRNWKYMNC